MSLSEQKFNLQIGLKIKRYRTQLKLSQKELGDMYSLSNTTISAYEMGKVSIPIHTLYKFAELFNVDVYDIIPPLTNSQYKLDEDELYLDQLYTELLEMDYQSKQQLKSIIQSSLQLYKHKK